jgi:multiple sugar transport system permease protein
MLSPSILFNLVIAIIGSFQTFTAAFVMTDGGPMNSTLFYVLYLYRNAFKFFKMGYASALAWILFVVILICTLLVFRSSPMWVFYEAEVRR